MRTIKVGGEFQAFIERQNLPSDSKVQLIDSTKKILTRTETLDSEESSNCQLVLGEVQSGKTLSFTALIALAHENEFPLVIVLAGTKNILLEQTTERLRRDLRADGDGGANPWIIESKLKKSKRLEITQRIQKNLAIWAEKDAPNKFKQTVIITCLKNRDSLDEIREIIQALKSPFNVNRHPVLIIDDEGDQAGLNLRHQQNDESPIYAAINRLRRSLKRHSYVMYTATPQGPLLLNIQDALSPKYVTLLQSGENYLGGEDLFVERGDFVKYIPNYESEQIFDIDPSAAAPSSLKRALAFYLLTLYVAQNRLFPRPVSMLVHPSVRKNTHARFRSWVNSILDSWQLLFKDQTENSYVSERDRFFKDAQIELETTYKLPMDWNLDLVLAEIRWWISKIEVRVINSENDDIKPNEWPSKAGWIIIGGNNLERGFTIENLAVTYMPRSIAGGNVDVLQQRGRFFGYKRQYKDLLRGWFFQDTAQAYFDYVSHEKSIRDQLREIDSTNGKLSDWRRRFLLDASYNPVRSQVISMGIIHKRLSTFKQQTLFAPDLHQRSDEFLKQVYREVEGSLTPMVNDQRPKEKNYYAEIPLERALELLTDWPMASDNRLELDDLIFALRWVTENGEIDKAAIVLMDWDNKRKAQGVRERSMLHSRANPSLPKDEQRIANLWQGPTSKSGGNYPGDSQMFVEGAISIQIHRVRPFYELSKRPDVAALGLIVPKSNRGYLAQIIDD